MNSLAYWNCASGFRSKKTLFEKILLENELDVLGLAESDVSQKHENMFMNIQNYELQHAKTFLKNGKTRLSAYVKIGSSFKRRLDLEDEFNEIMCFENDLRKEYFTILYRPFTYNDGNQWSHQERFKKLLENLKRIMSCGGSQSIVGDINIDQIELGNYNYRLHNLSEMLQEFIEENGLDQKITEITRHRWVKFNNVKTLQTSLLDHLYQNFTDVRDISVIPSIASDHDILMLKGHKKSSKSVKFTYYDWKRFSEEKWSVMLDGHDWTVLNDCQNAKQLCDHIEQETNRLLSKIVTMKTGKLRNINDIRSPAIEAIKKERNKLLKKSKLGDLEAGKKVKILNKKLRCKIGEEKKFRV